MIPSLPASWPGAGHSRMAEEQNLSIASQKEGAHRPESNHNQHELLPSNMLEMHAVSEVSIDNLVSNIEILNFEYQKIEENFDDDMLFGDGCIAKKSSNGEEVNTVKCLICINEIALQEIVTDLICNCFICKKCFVSYINNVDINTIKESGLPCPKCHEIIELYIIRQLAGQESYEKVNRIIVSMLSSAVNFIQCPLNNCQKITYVDEISTNSKIHCSSCNASICASCNISPYHDFVTCDEYKKQLKTSEGDIRPDTIFPCPKCSSLIESLSNCNLMKCSQCKIQICAECKKEIFDNYRHFEAGKCRLLNQNVLLTTKNELPLPLLAPYFGIIPNWQEEEWLEKHLKYRPKGYISAFLDIQCDQCNYKSNCLPVVLWDCGHHYCYSCGSKMFNEHPEHREYITYKCIMCILNTTLDQWCYSVPALCNYCKVLPRISPEDLYCSSCNTKIVDESEYESKEAAARPSASFRPQPQTQEQTQQNCAICLKLINNIGDYCDICSKVIAISMKQN